MPSHPTSWLLGTVAHANTRTAFPPLMIGRTGRWCCKCGADSPTLTVGRQMAMEAITCNRSDMPLISGVPRYVPNYPLSRYNVPTPSSCFGMGIPNTSQPWNSSPQARRLLARRREESVECGRQSPFRESWTGSANLLTSIKGGCPGAHTGIGCNGRVARAGTCLGYMLAVALGL